MSKQTTQALIRFLTNTLTHTHTQGIENLPATGGYIAAANHLGRLDVALVYSLLNREDIILLVAEKYRESALWRWMVKELDAIWVDRFNADFHAMRAVLQRLHQGGVLVIAPEGTRSPTGGLIQGKPGASFLATKSGLPVVPVAVVGTEDARVKAGLRRLQLPSVTVRAGEPFYLPPAPAKDREAALQRNTDEIMCRIAALLPESHRGVYAAHPRLGELLSDPR
jgi:1-acyl-sn-glycerol-3-phosphate acyltransferase